MSQQAAPKALNCDDAGPNACEQLGMQALCGMAAVRGRSERTSFTHDAHGSAGGDGGGEGGGISSSASGDGEGSGEGDGSTGRSIVWEPR